MDGIRQSYIFKIVQRMVDRDQTDIEVFLNGVQIISDLILVKPVFKEITSTRCLELFKQRLNEQENEAAK